LEIIHLNYRNKHSAASRNANLAQKNNRVRATIDTNIVLQETTEPIYISLAFDTIPSLPYYFYI